MKEERFIKRNIKLVVESIRNFRIARLQKQLSDNELVANHAARGYAITAGRSVDGSDKIWLRTHEKAENRIQRIQEKLKKLSVPAS